MMHNWNSEAERLPSSCKLHLSYFEIIINKTENAAEIYENQISIGHAILCSITTKKTERQHAADF